MWGDILTNAEAVNCQRIIKDFDGVHWVRPLLNRIQNAGGVKYENKPLLFELRFAWELNRLGVSVDYEYRTGMGNSAVDFHLVCGGVGWLIELVSLQVSDAVRAATREEGNLRVTELSSDASDPSQTEEAGMIRAQEKILDKVYSSACGPIKFPVVQQGRYHVIVCDMRGYLIGGGDRWDYRQITLGKPGLPMRQRLGQLLIRYWPVQGDRPEPIKGLFEKSNPASGARTLQERIHFLGFVNEKTYGDNTIQTHSYYLPNPHFFSSDDAVQQALEHYPMLTARPDG